MAFNNKAPKPSAQLNDRVAAGNPHANGGGTPIEGGKFSTFVFNAVEHTDGSVVGHLNYKFRSGDISIRMDIN